MTTGYQIMTGVVFSTALLAAIAIMPADSSADGHERGRGGDQWSAGRAG